MNVDSQSPSGPLPTGRADEPSVNEDLRAIRRAIETDLIAREVWESVLQHGGGFIRQFNIVALAAQDWEGATRGQQLAAIRVLLRTLGREGAHLLMLLASARSKHDWKISVRKRKESEKPDQGASEREAAQDHWDYLIASEVYMRMRAGQPKHEAIASVKEDYRTGAPYPPAGNFPPLSRPKRTNLPGADGIEKWLNRFRRKAGARGYVDPNAAFTTFAGHHEPDLKLSDIPRRGRPKKNR